MLEFQQSESIAERRRWILVLVDSTDGVTGKTGQTGQVYISKNGGTPALSTNSIVEVSSANMPGHYYIELTAAELSTLGQISISFKAASTLAFHDRGIVSYNNPFASVGGFSGGGGAATKFTLTNTHLDMIAKRVWEYAINESIAQDLLIKASEHPVTDMSPLSEQIKGIVIPEVDLSPVIGEIRAIKFPEIKDYTSKLSDLESAIRQIIGSVTTDSTRLDEALAALVSKVHEAASSISLSLEEVDELKKGFSELCGLIEEFGTSVKEQSDMDKRFEGMTSTMQKQQLAELTAKFDGLARELLMKLSETKFEILEEITSN